MLGHLILDLSSIQLMFLITLYIPTPASLLALLTFMLRSRGFLLPTRILMILKLMKQRSTWRELKFVSFALSSFAPVLHNSSVKLCTNNRAVAFSP